MAKNIILEVNYLGIDFLITGNILEGCKGDGYLTPDILDSFSVELIKIINPENNYRKKIKRGKDYTLCEIYFKDIYSEIQDFINQNYNKYI